MSFQSELLSWYSSFGRTLPWRKMKDPYLTWISEIMLQQTQVETVIPYFNRWRKKFPSVNSLAGTSVDSLLKNWEGLGYYSRCRNIHKAAIEIQENFNGNIPNTWKNLIKLPGVGEYTAGAILSIGFNEKFIAIDANVKRIMSRIMMIADPSSAISHKKIKQQLEEWISERKPGDFNQAMMDLGSSVCISKDPLCLECPVNEYCQAYRHDEQDNFPIRKIKSKKPHKLIVAGIIWEGNRFFIQKRPPSGLLGGLWEFPGGKIEPNETRQKALKREIYEECNIKVEIGKEVGTIDHAYSHFSISMTLFNCKLKTSDIEIRENTNDQKWIMLEEVDKYAFPKANHKLFKLLMNENTSANV